MLKFRKIQLALICISFLFTSCSGQEKESYWKTETVEKISGELFHGLTLAYMKNIVEGNIHVKKYHDSLQFHYPFKKKVKISELKSISNFKLFEDYDRVLDSVYDVSVENEELKIKFYYLGSDNTDNQFSLNLKEISKEDYFNNLKKIENELKIAKEEIKPFNFKEFNLEVIKPTYFNEKTLSIITKNNKSINVYHPNIQVSDFGGKNPHKVNGLAIKFNDNINCAATYKKYCFESIEYLWNKKNNKPSAIVLLKKEKQTKSEIVKLFNKINKDLKSEGFYVWEFHKELELNWITKNEIIRLVIEKADYFSEEGFDEMDIYGTNEYYIKLFKHFSKSITKSKIKIYIVSKELDNVLRTRSGGKTGEMIDYEPYYKNYR